MPPETEELERTDAEILDAETEVEEVETPEVDEEEVEESEEKETEKEASDEDKPFPYERPSIAEIKAKFPDFFKEFPVFRDVVFQEIEYRKVFPTIEDAKESLEDSVALSGLRDSVLAGKSEDVVDAIQQTDKQAAVKFAATFLPTLYKKDQELYQAAVTPLLETLCRKLAASSDENQKNSAYVIAQYLFGKDGEAIVDGKATYIKNFEETEDQKKIKQERVDFETSKYNEFAKSVDQEMIGGMTKLITRTLDPDGTMSEYAKKTLISDIISQVDKSLAADKSHMSVMNARWLRARKEGLNLASKEKLVSAYLSRAKQVIPSIRDKARNDFLGVRSKTAAKKSETIESRSSKTKEITSGRNSSTSRSKDVLKPSRDLYRKMSDMDILNSD